MKKLTKFSRELNLITGEQLNISIQGLKEHKTRSLLTMLGIIFGVAAVISMLAIGEGARRKTLSQIQSLGLNNIIIDDISKPEDVDKNTELLNTKDLTSILSVVPTIETGVPVLQEKMEANYKNRFEEIELIGTTSEYFNIVNLSLARGGFFSNIDNKLHNRVCVIGTETAKSLFLIENPIGKKIKINNIWFTVIGVLNYQPVSIAGNTEVNLNGYIFTPIKTIQTRFTRDPKKSELDQIIVRVKESPFVVSSSEFIDQLIFRHHNEYKNYKLLVPEQLLKQSEETQKVFNIVMGAIAGISLLVGGIGIMNIMLASILERTREIGLRRAIGATQHDIRNQFLIESSILSLLGGLIGIIIGYILTFGVTSFSDWETAVSLWSIVLSVGVSSIIGIIFGYFPASKAAELDPIEALRYE